MPRLLLLLFAASLSFSVFSQNQIDTVDTTQNTPFEEEEISTSPKFILHLRKSEPILDSIQIKTADPNRIKKIEVIKSGEKLIEYNSPNGIIIVYPKWRFRRYFKKMLQE